MANLDQRRIAAYYDRLVDLYGHDPRACDASSAASLSTRYEILSQVSNLAGKSVLEVGCGFGDLGAYLRSKYDGVRYLGIDVSRRMVEEGRRSHPELSLRVQDVLEMDGAVRFDVVLAQGIFYLLGRGADKKMRALIEKMFALANEALAFCAISKWDPGEPGDEFLVDPKALLSACRRLTPRLVLRHDYLPHDVAIYLYKTSLAIGGR